MVARILPRDPISIDFITMYFPARSTFRSLRGILYKLDESSWSNVELGVTESQLVRAVASFWFPTSWLIPSTHFYTSAPIYLGTF